MKFAYFPGCSAKTGGAAYEKSFLAVCDKLGIEMEELDEWNCCGATSYMSVDESYAYALSTRNLALAEKTGMDLVAPCGGCYGILLKSDHYYKRYPILKQVVADGLSHENLVYEGKAVVRHPLEVLAQMFGTKALRKEVKRPLKGLKVACYYGCRILRPIAPFEDMHHPQTMENLMKSVGARIAEYPLNAKCCGGAVAGVLPEAGLDLIWMILRDIERNEGDVIATSCPLCQFNLEAYQEEIIRKHPEIKPIPVLYFTQLIGLALGIEPRELGLDRLLLPVEPLLREKGILADAKVPAEAK
ncbi:MAG TPA: CoB--CoM heterodisulfide reductase iron-sulfur subunit B family protein [Fimbriimonas sp.]